MTQDTQHFKELLEKEKALLESELATVSVKNPRNPSDWQAVVPDMDKDRADEGDVADDIEGLQNNNAIVNQLEPRLLEVKNALEKIEKGKFGLCEVCGTPIEVDRLEANPAAATCKAHMN